jgi:hypothetical protein
MSGARSPRPRPAAAVTPTSLGTTSSVRSMSKRQPHLNARDQRHRQPGLPAQRRPPGAQLSGQGWRGLTSRRSARDAERAGAHPRSASARPSPPAPRSQASTPSLHHRLPPQPCIGQWGPYAEIVRSLRGHPASTRPPWSPRPLSYRPPRTRRYGELEPARTATALHLTDRSDSAPDLTCRNSAHHDLPDADRQPADLEFRSCTRNFGHR